MKLEAARLAMVESQIRPNGVRDPLILNAFANLPREQFVPESQRQLAYVDEALLAVPATYDSPARYLLAPMVLARMIQFAAPAAKDHALDIGGVTGYSAAILGQLCAKVDALEASAGLSERMSQCLKAVGAGNVSAHSGPLERGFPAGKPFDLIFVNGGISGEPKELFEQLAEGGRLIAIVRKGWMGHAYLFTKSGGTVSGRPVFDAGADILPGFEAKPQFVF
jgi:protein-L-isoaspartate(D-aspartate) O-methyltransferase